MECLFSDSSHKRKRNAPSSNVGDYGICVTSDIYYRSFFPFFLKLVAKGDLELGYLDNRNNLRGMRKNRLPVLKEVGHVEDRG